MFKLSPGIKSNQTHYLEALTKNEYVVYMLILKIVAHLYENELHICVESTTWIIYQRYCVSLKYEYGNYKSFYYVFFYHGSNKKHQNHTNDI